MMCSVLKIVRSDYISVDALWGIQRVKDIAEKADVDCFPVIDNGKVVGVLTRNDLIKAHPNRIVLDAMTGSFMYIEANESIWKAKELLQDGRVDLLFAVQEDKVLGVITKDVIKFEIGKHIDLLTGLCKSDYILYKSTELLEQGREISVIFLDINNFGYIDKVFGHIEGDMILKEIAQILKCNIPEEAYLCRYGGDEFAVLTACNTEDSKVLAEKLLQAIRKHEFYHNISVSASVGIAGGRKNKLRQGSLYKTVAKLINLASLASTTAKNEKSNLVLGYSGIIDEISI